MSTRQIGEAGSYWQRIRSFSPNARKMILCDAARSFGWGVVSTLFNLYLVTLGYSRTFIGGLMSLGAFTIALSSLVAGPIVARIGAKKAIIFSAASDVLLGAAQVWYPVWQLLLATTVVNSITGSLFFVAYSPFMAENSTAYERTHLFGADRSFSIVTSFTGSTLAGFLPFWIGLVLLLPLNSPPTFQLALGGWTPKSGTLYPALRRLAEQQLIIGTRVAHEERPDAIQYHITSKGQQLLEEASIRLGDEVRIQDSLWRFLGTGIHRNAAASLLDWSVRERSPIGFAVMKCQCDTACNGPTQLRFLEQYREHLQRELDWVNKRLGELNDSQKD